MLTIIKKLHENQENTSQLKLGDKVGQERELQHRGRHFKKETYLKIIENSRR